ncbi:MAG: GGDEF domain-containing protein, partial [Lachnospiraceae bacterium]|nr:GGDEF domain-containing protein [Lachnospiraceae bacterium]
VLKLDMQFIRNAFSGSRDMRMVEVIIEIADSLSVPIVAEGVETEEQMHALKAMGCDIVQGYFFSKPVSAKEFTAFLQEKIKQLEEIAEKERQEQAAREAEAAAAAEQIRSEAAEEPVQTVRSLRGIRMRTATFAFVLMAFAVSLALLVSDSLVNRGYRRMDTASREYIAAQQAAANMEIGSDYLTDRVRCFAETGELRYLEDFFEELEVTKRRDRALTELETLMKGNGGNAYGYLAEALRLSNTLVEQEYLSMRLMIEAMGYDLDEMPAALQEIGIGEEYRDLSGEELSAEARELVFNERYLDYKEKIKKNVEKSTQELIEASATELDGSSARMFGVLTLQTILNLCLMLSIVVFVIFISTQVRKPLTKMVDRIRSGKDIPPKGAAELRFVAETYNEMFAENQKAHQQLTYDASHDALTGLYNRSAYEMLLQSSDQRHIALLIVDIDRFKNVNDQYGHDMGDRILKRVADILRSSFRSVDHICRIGGDEFAVIMTRVDSSHRRLVLNKVEQANVQLQHPQDDLPPVSLSVGVAFADRKNPQGDIFKDADTALYRVKEAGRCGCSIY